MEEVGELFNNYISHHKKNFDLYFIKFEFKIEFDNNFTTKVKTKYSYNTNAKNIKSYLLYYIDLLSFCGYNFYYINQMTINSIYDRCNLSNREYLKLPMHMVERRINLNFTNNPQLINILERNKNHLLIRKCFHILFNN